jgi:hypothetical protein
MREARALRGVRLLPEGLEQPEEGRAIAEKQPRNCQRDDRDGNDPQLRPLRARPVSG